MLANATNSFSAVLQGTASALQYQQSFSLLGSDTLFLRCNFAVLVTFFMVHLSTPAHFEVSSKKMLEGEGIYKRRKLHAVDWGKIPWGILLRPALQNLRTPCLPLSVFADVDFTTFTTAYLKKSSVIRRYSFFGIAAKSAMIAFHGVTGSGDIHKGSLLHLEVVAKHTLYDFI